MSAMRSLSPRQQQIAGTGGLLLIAALAVVLAAVVPAAAAILALGAIAGLALLVAAPRPAPARAKAAPLGESAAPLRLTLPDGDTRVARPVELPGEREERLLLTRDGYVVVNAAGNVIHRL